MQSKYQIIKNFIETYLDPKDKYHGVSSHELSIALVSEITEDEKEMQNFFFPVLSSENNK